MKNNFIFLFMLFNSFSAVSAMEIPLRFDESLLPMSNININGINNDFMIDTGSLTPLHFSKELIAKTPGIKLTGEKQRSMDISGRTYTNDKFIIDKAIINGMSFNHVEGVSLTPWGLVLLENGKKPDSMVIGLGLFKDKVILIDYKDKKISVAEDINQFNTDLNQWISLPLVVDAEGITIEIKHGNEKYKMNFDTGATLSLFWKERLKGKYSKISCEAVMNTIEHDNCDAIQMMVNAAENKLAINALLVEGDFKHMDVDGVIGNNFIQNHKILIDFPKHTLLIEP